MKYKKKYLLAACLLLICVLFPMSANASSKKNLGRDVTKTVSGRSEIKQLTDLFATYMGAVVYESIEKGESSNINFSRNAVRRKALRYISADASLADGSTVSMFTSAYQQKISRRVFGRSTKGLKKRHSGDWGDMYPVLTKKHIYRRTSSKYYVTGNFVWYDTSTGHTVRTKAGRFRLKLKKVKGSDYGYVATRLWFYKTRGI